jgi:hypothetical protein
MNAMQHTRIIAAGVVLAGINLQAQEQPLSPQQLEFFEAKIRPALVEYCYDCHSAEGKVKGGLQVDGKKALLQGGSTGPAVVAGKPSASLLVQAIQYLDEDLQMPPSGKMPDGVVADLVEWVRQGAPDPRTGKAAGILKSDDDRNKAKQHWAFQPVEDPPKPELTSRVTTWTKNKIDYFIQAKLEEKGLVPSPSADRHTLIRRAYFDLIGMPPSPEQVQAFQLDKSPLAWETVIDDLLASEHYGERWGRYWLDIARYADTRGGQQNNGRGPRNRMVHAWTYRDWVVDAFNKDKPYDEFLQQQIAADLLPISKGNKKDQAALALLTMGRAVENNQKPLVIDDQIDVITRGMMGLSVYCARCHDHKFDPVSQKDYYGLYGVFDSIQFTENQPLLDEPSENPMFNEYLIEKSQIIYDQQKFKVDAVAEYLGEAKTNTVRYMLVAHALETSDLYKLGSRAEQEEFTDATELEADIARNWQRMLSRAKGNKKDTLFAPWKEYTKLNQPDFSRKSRELAKKFWVDGTPKPGMNPLVAKAFSTPAKSLVDVAARYSTLFFKAEKAWATAVAGYNREKARNPKAEIPVIKSLKDKDMEQLRQVFYGRSSPVMTTFDRLKRKRSMRRLENEEASYVNDVELLEMNHPGAPRRAMSVTDMARPREPKIFVKGDPRNPGDTVRRKFIDILNPEKSPFLKGSGRMELARAIGSKKNPLTPRVAVNRVWMNHFGAPIVRTPTDFGLRAEEPTHPELLDHLSAYLINRNWSLKTLHKYIMTSATYQQSSEIRPKNMVVDGGNAYVWRMNRRRLDFESFRDSMLQVSGSLDPTIGGAPFQILDTPYTMRRTVYSYIDRQNLPALFRNFDFANPNMTTGVRFNSTVPQQALFMMNSPFIAELARNLVERDDVKNKIDETQKIEALHQACFQREPNPLEVKLGMRFLERQASIELKRKPSRIWSYGFGAYEPRTKRLLRFSEFPYYDVFEGAWQGTEEYPSSRFGAARLNADGGHPGPVRTMAVIRRWTSQYTGPVKINGNLEHLPGVGDGINAFILFKGRYEIGRYILNGRDVATTIEKLKVAKGDTLDFIVECRGSAVGDTFYWAPTIEVDNSAGNAVGSIAIAAPAAAAGGMAGGMAMGMTGGMGGGAAYNGPKKRWNSGEDFYLEQEDAENRALNSWEKYAQVLLLSNELSFVD